MFGFQYSPPIISSIRLENLEVSAQSAASNAASALTEVQALFDQVLEYRNESQYYYTQVQQIQEGDYVTTQSLTDTLGAVSFSDLASVPESFVPSAHSHLWEDITDKPATFAPSAHTHLWEDITDKPTEFEPADHVHSWLQIADKPGTFPPEMHYHDWESIENKPAKFNPAAHVHSWADVTGKPSAYPPAAHSHSWDAISGKPNVYHDGNSINAKLFGLGVYSLPEFDYAVMKGGIYNGLESGRVYFVGARVNTRAVCISASANASGASDARIAHYDPSNKGVFYEEKLFTSGNLNPNSFGVNSSSDVVCPNNGKAESSSRASFKFPINLVNSPASMIVTGTFYLIDVATAQIAAENITVSHMTLFGQSSYKVAKVLIDIAGLTAGREYELRAASNYSEIEFK